MTTRLRRLLLSTVLLCLCLGTAHAGKLDDDLQTVWEGLWDERGTPRQLMRWEHQVRYRIFGADAPRHREYIIRALEAAGQATHLRMINVSDDIDGEKTAGLQVEVANDNDQGLPDHQACFTRPLEWTNRIFSKVQIRMRSGSTWRCTFHEVMHAMGIPGHPSGKTVLSYFAYRRDTLMDLDKLMLAAWYSPAMPREATPFEALVVLSEAVGRQADLGLQPEDAMKQAQAFTLTIFKEMEAFASGQGDIPTIIKRSGKASGTHMDNARQEIGFFVGRAYLQGTITAKDTSAAAQWFKRTAEQGHAGAQIMWGLTLARGTGVERDQQAACTWYTRAAPAYSTMKKPELRRLELTLCPPRIEPEIAQTSPSE
jgi:hypothetical protein